MAGSRTRAAADSIKSALITVPLIINGSRVEGWESPAGPALLCLRSEWLLVPVQEAQPWARLLGKRGHPEGGSRRRPDARVCSKR